MITNDGILINNVILRPNLSVEEIEQMGNKIDVLTEVKNPHIKTYGLKDIYEWNGYKFKVAIVRSDLHEPPYIKLTKMIESNSETAQDKFQYYLNWLNDIGDKKVKIGDVATNLTIGNIVLYLWISNMGHCHSIRIYEKI